MKCSVTFDVFLCNGCGGCAELCPDIFQMNDTGDKAELIQEIVECNQDLSDAAMMCPEDCIKVEEIDFS